MTQKDFFGAAEWVSTEDCTADSFLILHGRFHVRCAKRVHLSVLGLGFFKCYINGICINPDTFLPLSSDYEAGVDPRDEVLTAHRIYVPSFEIGSFVRTGENTIDVHFGGGWYTNAERVFGLPKAIYRVTVFEEESAVEFLSDTNCLISKSGVVGYDLTTHECQDYSVYGAFGYGDNFDCEKALHAVAVKPLQTEYCETDCPRDALCERIIPQCVGMGDAGKIYDCGKNLTGYPVLAIEEGAAGEIAVLFSEELSADGKLDPCHAHKQKFTVSTDGKVRTVQPEFTWFGFRYFEVIGRAVPEEVKLIHADVSISSSFESDNQTLNWIYQTFLHTMLSNMHTGHPSDCPHIERRGYTGDGQLTCHAALSVFDARAFYKKWLQDIADSQDVFSGHIQNAAPYIRSGGGPGGWGSAIVEVPYQLYSHYGDTAILSKYYPNMCRYIDYLESHSEFGLVTSDKKGEWCLGDWCGPIILYPDKDITSTHNQQVLIPAAMVNTYFMAKSLGRMARIAEILEKNEDAAKWKGKAEERKNAIRSAYFNAFDNNFIMNVQGANAYAVDLGLGNERTYQSMVKYYEKLGHYDTGIFATDILTRVLFEHGDADLAVALLTQNGAQGYEHWRKNGATTFHEYWDSNRSRSHCHPMFGAVVAYFFEYLLGIRQAENSVGYTSLVIAPCATEKFAYMKGSMQTPKGKVAVSYEHRDGAVHYRITVPSGVRAVFGCDDGEKELFEGENLFSINT